MKHWHIEYINGTLSIPHHIEGMRTNAWRTYDGLDEMIRAHGCTALKSRIMTPHGEVRYYLDGSHLGIRECGAPCITSLLFDPVAEEKKRLEELARLPRDPGELVE